MRLVSFGPAGGEQPGVLIDDRTLMPVAPVLGRAGLECRRMPALLAMWPMAAPLIADALRNPSTVVRVDEVRLGPPVPDPATVVAIGFNYPLHSAGLLAGIGSAEPIVFLKPTTSVTGPSDPVLRPPETRQLDYELELGVVIGRTARRVSRDRAAGHIAGYLMANDITARDVALGAAHRHPLLAQIARGKGSPSFCPTGPWLATPDELPDGPLELRLSVNGELRQSGSTAQMLVDVPGLIESVTSSVELRPGDILLTGTPDGCGFQLDPPRFLQPGDRVSATITGLGRMDLTVQDEPVPAGSGPEPADRIPAR